MRGVASLCGRVLSVWGVAFLYEGLCSLMGVAYLYMGVVYLADGRVLSLRGASPLPDGRVPPRVGVSPADPAPPPQGWCRFWFRSMWGRWRRCGSGGLWGPSTSSGSSSASSVRRWAWPKRVGVA